MSDELNKIKSDYTGQKKADRAAKWGINLQYRAKPTCPVKALGPGPGFSLLLHSALKAHSNLSSTSPLAAENKVGQRQLFSRKINLKLQHLGEPRQW